MEMQQRVAMFRNIARADWPKIRRFIGYYQSSNWAQFDAEGARLLGSTWPAPDSEWQRHDVLHRALELFFLPLWLEPVYAELKQEFHDVFGRACRSPECARLAQECVSSGEIREKQRDIFRCMELFVTHSSLLLPALPIEYYPKEDKALFSKLRLYRDDFHILRDLYISTFEACHHVLRYVVGILNIANRGSAESFNVGGPKSLKAFEKLVNADKVKHLSEMNRWSAVWPSLFDRHLRNAIGHHTIRHDLATGALVSNDGASIPYVEFVTKALRLIHGILAATDVLKMYFITVTIAKKS